MDGNITIKNKGEIVCRINIWTLLIIENFLGRRGVFTKFDEILIDTDVISKPEYLDIDE